MRIFVWHGKHSTEYYDASTPELWAENALELLTMLDKEGWYYRPDTSKTQQRIMTEEQIAALPEHLRPQARQEAENARREWVQETADAEWYDEMREVVDTKDLTVITRGKGRWERQVPRAWDLLDARREHEYERVELIDLHQPKGAS